MKFYPLLSLSLFLAFTLSLPAQEEQLELLPGDATIEIIEGEEGFHLWVRAKPGLGSLILSESSADPEKRANSYTLRSSNYNPINGDEKRVLNNEFLDPNPPLYFLLDSSPEPYPLYPEGAFHVFIPYAVEYGYSWSREGQLEIGRDSWINVRTFSLPYADYNGAYRDNPFFLNFEELPVITQENASITERSFRKIAEATDGDFEIAQNEGEAGTLIREKLRSLKGPQLDLVFVIDTTISMRKFVDYVKKEVDSIISDNSRQFINARVGFVFYRDYKEEYLTKRIAYQSDPKKVKAGIQKIQVKGGQDIEEAVYEGLYAAMTEFSWAAEDNLVILIGDAPPHRVSRDVTSADVFDTAKAKDIQVFTILLINDKKGDVKVKESTDVEDFETIFRNE